MEKTQKKKIGAHAFNNRNKIFIILLYFLSVALSHFFSCVYHSLHTFARPTLNNLVGSCPHECKRKRTRAKEEAAAARAKQKSRTQHEKSNMLKKRTMTHRKHPIHIIALDLLCYLYARWRKKKLENLHSDWAARKTIRGKKLITKKAYIIYRIGIITQNLHFFFSLGILFLPPSPLSAHINMLLIVGLWKYFQSNNSISV